MRTHADAGCPWHAATPGPAALVLVAWLASAGVAGAQAQARALDGVEIEWDGPADCATPEGVRGAVAELVGPTFRSKGEASFEVTVEPTEAGGFDIDIEASGDEVEGERRITAASCKEARDVVALLVAIALDPQAAARADVEAPEPWAPSEPEPHRSGTLVGAGAMLDTGSLLALAVAPELRFAWDLGALRAGVRGRVYLQTRAENLADGHVTATLWSGTADACYLVRRPDFAVGPCAGFEIGWLSGHGVPDTGASWTEARDGAPWVGATAGAELEVALGETLGLDFTLGGAVPLPRPVFHVERDLQPTETLEPDVATFRAGVGLVLHLP